MKKKFTVYYHLDAVYEAVITAESITDALEQAKAMTKAELDAKPGTVIDETTKITAVFE